MADSLESNSKNQNNQMDLWANMEINFKREINNYHYHGQFLWAPKTPEKVNFCTCCPENKAVATCRDCDVYLCEVCEGWHPKNCFIVELSTDFYGPVYEETLFYCAICKSYVSGYCKTSKHRSSQVRILQDEVTKSRNEAKQHLNEMQYFISNLIAYIEQVYKGSPLAYHICNTRLNDAIAKLHLFIHKYITYKNLLDRCKNAADIYNTKFLTEKFTQDVKSFTEQIELQLDLINSPSVAFPYSPFCFIPDQGTNAAVVNQFTTFTIHARDIQNGPTALDQNFISIQCDQIDNFFISQDNNKTKCLIKYIPTTIGTVKISVKILNMHVRNSPMTIQVRVRDLTKISIPVKIFGSKGEADGEFSRPWGVCCDAESRIIVADRSNHRVQVFSINGKFLFKFGTQGADEGQFNLPVGVTVDDEYCRIIVVDKDNHRIQLFTLTGDFVFTFGELGSGNGQLNYPWDVAVNSAHEILVADSRNHRVQLFSFSGQFLSVCPMQIFNSPRGICFTHDDKILVSDFDYHFINVLSNFLTFSKTIGISGEEDGQFNRPSGIAVDKEGNIFVVDSKNHRIQVLDRGGVFKHKFGRNGSGDDGEFNRPSDICVSPEGKIIIVDFENSRVQIY